ncbi:phytoene synthase 2, chloroplastic-like isoform X3 [Populus nigra]|uniref:phytoene synthase 2, chloroplastic-like isoform X3 n=1 Tax=Populus nigra TaxID=3691 RepID=UPI002B26BEF2|nr:phytoene synthase 2, chloroplastic-like isoform X3 [Populus nigra]
MCSTFSFSTNPCNYGANNARFLHSKSLVTRTRAQGIRAHKCPSSGAIPRPLIKEFIPRTDLRVHEIVERQSQANNLAKQDACRRVEMNLTLLEEAYKRCRNICAEYARTYYLASLLMTEERQKAIWAIYGERLTSLTWGTRMDEMVDGPNAVYMGTSLLDRWEERLQDIFDGRPYDMLDAALTDTVSNFCLDIKPFKEMIEGMRMDTWKSRNSFWYCKSTHKHSQRCGGGVSFQCLSFAIATCSTWFQDRSFPFSLLSAWRGRIYLPQDELEQFGLSDEDVFARKVTDNWREFMKEQIARARFYYNIVEQGISRLDKASHWPLWSSLLLYQNILDVIEENDYDNLTKRAHVGKTKKLIILSHAYKKAQSVPSSIFH